MQTFNDYQKRYMDPSSPGLIADSSGVIDRIYRFNSGGVSGQVIDPLTVGGTIGTETFTITIAGYSSIVGTFSEDIEVTAEGGDTATDVATELAAAVNTNEVVNDLLTAASAGAVITLTLNEGQTVTTVAGAATGAGTLTAAPTITAPTDAALIPYGFVVASYPSYSNQQCSLPNSATDIQILGIAVWRQYHEANYPATSGNTYGYPARAKVEIFRKGKIWVPAPANVVRGTRADYDPTTGQIVANGNGTAFPGTEFAEGQDRAGNALLDINVPQTTAA